MFKNEHGSTRAGRHIRAVKRLITKKANAAERIPAAQAKRDRRNAKRAATVDRSPVPEATA